MAKFWQDNLIHKVIALLLAMILWLYVITDENPPIDKITNVNITYENLNEEYVLTEKVTSVNVKVKGDSKIVNNLSEKDIVANVDLSHVQLGRQSIAVKVSTNVGIEITDIFPREISINVDKVAEKQVPVKIALMGQTAHGYSSFKATVKPSHVVLRGPQDILKNIVEARVDVNLDDAKANLELNLPMKVQDQRGNTYSTENLKMNPETVEVFVPVLKDTPSKTVPIKSVFRGKPASNYQISRTILEPETVKILGQFDNLENINYINTEPIDIENISENTTKEVDLRIPEGLSTLYEAKVKVMIQVEEKPKPVTFERKINIRNQEEGKKVKINPTLAYIKVEGNKEIVNHLNTKNVQLFADVAGLELGTHQVEVSADVPLNVQILKIDPMQVTVEITEEQEEKDKKEEKDNR